MTISPMLALAFGWEAFFPAASTSVLGGTIYFMGKTISSKMSVGQLTAELMQELVFAEKDRRDLVLAEVERKRAELVLG